VRVGKTHPHKEAIMSVLDLQAMDSPIVDMATGSSTSGQSCGSDLSVALCGPNHGSELSALLCGGGH
jgi:hypothetical protein